MDIKGLRGLKVLSTVLCVCHTLLFSCSFAYSLHFHTQPASVVQKLGSAVHLHCMAVPASASITWLFQGHPIEPGALPGMEVQSGTLFLPFLQPQNTGFYQCVARSDTGAIASRRAQVAIADIEEFRDTPLRSLAVKQGETAVIKCLLPRSNPSALPRYRIRGKWLVNSTDEYLILPSGNLQIISVSKEDQGMYKCGAYNPVTKEVRIEARGTKLIVKESHGLSTVGIIYPISPIKLTVEQSKALVLECIISGNPVVRWMKDGLELTLVSRIRLLHSNLLLSDVQLSDRGNYTCIAQKEDGSVASAILYTVDVLEAPSVIKGLSDRTVNFGSSVQFTCDTLGNPVPKITWLFNSLPILPSSRFNISDSSLHIISVSTQDQGMYQCLLDNGIGSTQSAARFMVQSEHQSSFIAADTNAQPSINPVQSDEGEGLSLHLEEGFGDTVGPISERTSNKPTPEAPIIISPPQTHKPNTYDLEWRSGRDWGNPITAYFVKYRKVNDMSSVVGSWHTVRVPGSEKNLLLSDLEPSSLYEVLMVARSTAGEGQPAMLTFRTGKERSPPSNKNPSKAPVVSQPEKVPEEKVINTHYGVVIHDRVPEAPDRPTISMASENSVYVAWIPRANGGSPITAFRVEFRKQGRSGDWTIADDNISPLKLSVEVRNLEPGSTYRFRVIALNNYGESAHSATSRTYQVAMTSQPTSNRPVTGPHISSTDAVSDTHIMVRWTYTPSSNNNTPIQGFYIYYRPTDSDNDSDYKKDMVEGVKRWHMIAQLQPETSYDIKMQCFNDAGESEYSNVMICETRVRQPPGAPSQQPISPPEGYPPSQSTQSGGGILYLIVGSVLGIMVLTLLIFIVICLWKNRQQNNMLKHNPPGYLYPPTEMNGHIMDYTALSASSQHNGSVHAGYGHNRPLIRHGCHHLHHKLPNGMTLLNSPGPLYTQGHSHTHDTSQPKNSLDYEYTHPHHIHNGEGVYTSVAQTDSTDCMNCQNFCNNNRCYTKANGGTHPLMHHLLPCQLDSIEMVPLSRASFRCHDKGSLQHYGNCEQEDEIREEIQDLASTSSNSQSLTEELEQRANLEQDPGNSNESLVCLERKALPDLDCKEKPVWISHSSLTGELIQPTMQEI
ncbi:cell adhesion molecule-related/down-regulated by oncogenes [Trichomycterus rosablanca]|uniref:cell adhesion molecule-related/down-regulated by oncogenes n=1 Tax=Trichomycterus rosablanca TaxID=2290929 RepID=UPI002F353D82